MNALVQALGWTLLHFLWQGLLIAGATALALAVLRNARAEARYGKVEGSSIARSSGHPALDEAARSGVVK